VCRLVYCGEDYGQASVLDKVESAIERRHGTRRLVNEADGVRTTIRPQDETGTSQVDIVIGIRRFRPE